MPSLWLYIRAKLYIGYEHSSGRLARAHTRVHACACVCVCVCVCAVCVSETFFFHGKYTSGRSHREGKSIAPTGARVRPLSVARMRAPESAHMCKFWGRLAAITAGVERARKRLSGLLAR